MDKNILEESFEKAEFKITKYDSDGNLIDESEFEGNSLLNEGINNLTTLIGSTSGTEWSNANAYLGVGDSSVATDSTMTGLQGTSTNYEAQESGYPTYGSNQEITWKSSFDSQTANHSWQEFTVGNASDSTGDNLNRAVSDEGTKSAGQTWELEMTITFS